MPLALFVHKMSGSSRMDAQSYQAPRVYHYSGEGNMKFKVGGASRVAGLENNVHHVPNLHHA